MSGQKVLIEYSGSELYSMNFNSTWNGSIILPNNGTTEDLKDDNNKYLLHATREISEKNGRQFIVLPVDLKITDELAEQYNLFSHEGDYKHAVASGQVYVPNHEHNHSEIYSHDHSADCGCCKY